MSDHAKFYADCGADPGDWLAVDGDDGMTASFRERPTRCPELIFVGPVKELFSPSVSRWNYGPFRSALVTRNGITMHFIDTLWQVPQPAKPELSNEQRLVIYCAARDVQRGKSMRHRGEHKRLLALADYALVFGSPEQHRVLCDKADRHRIAADRFGAKADHWNRRACVIRKRIK